MKKDNSGYLDHSLLIRCDLSSEIRYLRQIGTPEALKEADEKQAELAKIHRRLRERGLLENYYSPDT